MNLKNQEIDIKKIINRRNILKAIGASPLLAISTPVRALNESDVIVIGAGLSGLNAALLLEKAGLDVKVIEARNRIGGRVQSLRNIPGNPEVGGTAFGPGYARLVDAANNYGAELIDITPTIPFFFDRQIHLKDELISMKDWPESSLNPFPDQLRDAPPWAYLNILLGSANPLKTLNAWREPENKNLDISLHKWLNQIGQNNQTIDLAYNTNPTHSNSAYNVSALMVLFAAAFAGMQRQLTSSNPIKGYTAKGGNQSIPEAMANALKKEVLLNSIVEGIRSKGNNAEVYLTDGSVHRAKHIICSVPCSVLRRIKIDPMTTGAQARGINTLDSQIINQLHLIPKSPFWEKDGMSPNMFSDSLAGMVIAERKGEDPNDVSSLTVWLRGERAAWADQVDTDYAIKQVVNDLERIRPAAKDQLEVAGYKSWYRDPFASGDWAVFKPGQVNDFALEIGKPHEKIHFCGEHTALSNRGMEGAMESGERAALEILSLT
ncbi:MAG: FAD-dependent oxidoreductase [Pseudomonadota bacterium]|nr:FAD-dependent oxidoreductase [Pseudomonadota bacterium]